MKNIDYKRLFYHVCGVMADAVDCIDAGDTQRAKALLVAAQQRVEKQVMEQPDGAGVAFKPKKDKGER